MSSIKKKSRKEREKEFHKKVIVEAGIKNFAKYGYANTTIERIAKDSEFGKGTLYNYFPSKKAIFIESFKHAFEELLTQTKENLSGEEKLSEKLIAYVNSIVMYFKENKDIFFLLENVYYNIHIDKELKKAYDSKISEFNDQLTVLFEKKHKNNKRGILNASYIAILFNNYIFSFLYYFIFSNSTIGVENYESVAEELVIIFLRGYQGYTKYLYD